MAVDGGLRALGERIVRRDAMAHRGRMLALQITLDRGAAMVASLGCEKWAQWTGYFIECVDGLLAQRDVSLALREELLLAVGKKVDGKLEKGTW